MNASISGVLGHNRENTSLAQKSQSKMDQGRSLSIPGARLSYHFKCVCKKKTRPGNSSIFHPQPAGGGSAVLVCSHRPAYFSSSSSSISSSSYFSYLLLRGATSRRGLFLHLWNETPGQSPKTKCIYISILFFSSFLLFKLRLLSAGP